MKVNSIARYIDEVLSYDFIYDGGGIDVYGAVIDSRTIESGNIFFAISGSDVDGNSYAQSALNSGAAVAIMDNKVLYDSVKGNKILVKSSKNALLQMGKARLNECTAKKVAITGSFGKTTTKDMLALTLGEQYNIYATEGNFNNELGVSLMACGMPDELDMLVLEIGSNHKGEISALAELIQPELVILTGLGHAHVGNFGSIDAIADEKMSALTVASCKKCVINEVFKPYLDRINDFSSAWEELKFFGRGYNNDVFLADYTIMGNHMLVKFGISEESGIRYIEGILPFSYPHLAENVAGVLAASAILGVNTDVAFKAVSRFATGAGRGNWFKSGFIEIIDDTYNASYEAVLRAIEALDSYDTMPKYALIGEMGELGDGAAEIYRSLVREACARPDIYFIFSGDAYNEFAENKVAEQSHMLFLNGYEQTVEMLGKIKTGVLLIKASRAYKFERYVNYFKERGKDAL